MDKSMGILCVEDRLGTRGEVVLWGSLSLNAQKWCADLCAVPPPILHALLDLETGESGFRFYLR